jgi:hypothetical protein
MLEMLVIILYLVQLRQLQVAAEDLEEILETTLG